MTIFNEEVDNFFTKYTFYETDAHRRLPERFKVKLEEGQRGFCHDIAFNDTGLFVQVWIIPGLAIVESKNSKGGFILWHDVIQKKIDTVEKAAEIIDKVMKIAHNPDSQEDLKQNNSK
ncbi:hypothetical protein [Paenibacillus amylolyticus]|uniref:hypothetical protein n=1 Tax=Paenibacillus amylolyticus TaxID=1451 RepID=UPI0033989E7C